MAVCIFDSGKPLTNAHIFRKGWIATVCPRAEKFRHRRPTASMTEPGGTEFVKDVMDIKVKAVCGPCNDGWMEKLDIAAEDLFLTNAVLGYPAKVDKVADRQLLARWCALIGVLIDQTKATPVLPPRVHEAVYNGAPPDDAQIWLFNTQPPDDRDLAWTAGRHVTLTATMRPSGSTVARDFYFVTFCVKRLVVHVCFPIEPTPTGIKLWQGGGGKFSACIWPPEVAALTPLIWPPPETLPWETALDLPDSVTRIGA